MKSKKNKVSTASLFPSPLKKGSQSPEKIVPAARPTFFSELKSSTARAAEANTRLANVFQQLQVRIVPEKVDIKEYILGERIVQSVAIKNLSMSLHHVQVLSIHGLFPA
jgi:hypothetical protein